MMDRLTEWTGKRWIARQERLNGKIIGDDMVYAKLAMYEDIGLEPRELHRELLRLRANQAKNKKILKWHLCERKNGTKFLKLIYYSPEADGWVEVGRFNMSKAEFVNNQWSIGEIFEELQ